MRTPIAAIAWALLIALSSDTHAQGFPSKPVTIVVPLAAGGAVDTMVRVLIEPMRAMLGQPILVENVGGAGGTIGVTRVARAAPDGYTVSVGTWGTHVANSFIYSPPYDLLQDFAPVALLPSVPYWFVARKNLPPNDLRELIAWLKTNKATAGAVGTGGGATVCASYFQKATGTTLQMVPYRGGAPALQDLVAGQIDMICDLAANSLPQVRAGNIKAYAVSSKKRWFAAPDVPTADESGVPGLDVTTWHGAYAPKGTPPEAVTKLSEAFMAAMAEPNVRRRLADQGLEIAPREQQTAEAFAIYLKAEMDKWGPIIRASGIKAQ